MRDVARTALLPAVLGAVAACSPPAEPPITGYVEAEYLRVASPVAGRLVALSVERGASVSAGAPLFAVEPDLAALALREAESRAQAAQASARDLTRGARRDELAAAQAALAAAQAAAAQAASDLKRQQALAAQGFVSSAGLDALRARRDATAADAQRLAADLRTARLGARDDRQAAAEAEAAAARDAVAQQRFRLGQTSVAAPAAARVVDTLLRPGEWAAAGAPVVQMLEPTALKLRFFVPEALLARVPVGSRVRATCDGCSAPFDATVRYVAPEAEFTPPVVYTERQRQRMVFLVEAWPVPGAVATLHPGLPVDVQLGVPGPGGHQNTR
ncbi:HlyD family efflux transporter periplasmic adaptor subunit [Aquincola sp. MAHUQ-54]|uniref:HlyD family efflux transporter periplasmic adaptor subunit n=1 Tax=Aquincola agrisoli TaxID=3119538 RepID=A0AAW9QKK6_9BURK